MRVEYSEESIGMQEERRVQKCISFALWALKWKTLEGGTHGVVFDIEADGLLYGATRIWCIATLDTDTGLRMFFGPGEIESGLAYLSEQEELIGHNIGTFDIPCIRKLYPSWTFKGKLTDTMLLGCMLYPEDGVMSLEDWSLRLGGTSKVQHEDWSQYSGEMGLRCQSDVEINYNVLKRLQLSKEYHMVKDGPMDLEVSVALVHAQQVLNGVTFDLQAAVDLAKELDTKLLSLRDTIVSLAPRKVLIEGVPKSKQQEVRKERTEALSRGELVRCVMPFKKDGSYTANVKRFWGDAVSCVKGPYTRIDIKELNPDSDEELKELLLDLGWKPTEWNTVKDKVTGEFRTTSPKLTEDSYESLPEGLGKTVAEFSVLSHRRSWLASRDGQKGAIREYFKRRDGRISAEAFTCGTPTARYRHQGTVCNIPRVGSILGKEIRSLFCVPEGSHMVGVDLSGIEARMLCHYVLLNKCTGAEETAKAILSKDKTDDFHTQNGKLWGVSRDTGKSGLYCLLYGGSGKKLAQTLKKPEHMGNKLKDDFYKKNVGIKELNDTLQRAYKSRGYLIGLDGRPLYIRSEHKLLNTLLQNAATIVFKNWMVLCNEEASLGPFKEKLRQLIAMHDETQWEVIGDELVAKLWATSCESLAEIVGERLKILVPIAAEAKIGGSWGECH